MTPARRRRASPTPRSDRGLPNPTIPRSLAILPALGLAVALAAGTARANGGTVRIAEVPVGPWAVTVYSSPTPLRTGEIDISTLVQDSGGATVDVPITVTATPVGFVADPVLQPATRRQATNKLFKAAKFDLGVPGRWDFRIHVGSAAAAAGAPSPVEAVDDTVGRTPPGIETEEPGGVVSFDAVVAKSTILDRPFLLAALVALPLMVAGWLLLGREPEVHEVGDDHPRA